MKKDFGPPITSGHKEKPRGKNAESGDHRTGQADMHEFAAAALSLPG